MRYYGQHYIHADFIYKDQEVTLALPNSKSTIPYFGLIKLLLSLDIIEPADTYT